MAHRSHFLILDQSRILGFSLIKFLLPLTNLSTFVTMIGSLNAANRFEFSSHYMNYRVAATLHDWVPSREGTTTFYCDSASSSPEMHSLSPCTFSFHMPAPFWVRNSPSTIDPVSQYTKYLFNHIYLLTPSISYLSSLASLSFPPVATSVLSVRQPIQASNSCILRVKFSFSICNTWVFCSNSVIFLFFSSISASCLQCETWSV
jgi:hypothetical protein